MFTAPEAPVNLQVTERTAHAIHLMWQHPNITNGKVRQFYISVKLISSHLRRPEREVNMPERLLKVQQPSRNYLYEVSESGVYIFYNEVLICCLCWNACCYVQESTQKKLHCHIM